jgi:pilus assembly protein CpaC
MPCKPLRLASLAVLALAFAPQLADAADPARAGPRPLAPVNGPATGRVLGLSVGRGELLRFGQPVRTILVANPDVADVEIVSEKTAYVFGVAVGRTNIFALGPNDALIETTPIDVRRDSAAFQSEARRVSGDGVSAEYLGARPGTAGEVRSVESAVRLAALAQEESPAGRVPLNLTRYAGSNQINLRVRFAEVSRTAINRLGVNWRAVFDINGATISLLQGAAFAGGGPFVGGLAETFASAALGTSDVDVLLEALQREGVLSVLAEPNLTTVSGKPAQFLAGGEFPIPVPQSNDAITVEFRQFGIALDFTPSILPDNRLAIEVAPEVSTLDNATAVVINGFFIPGLNVRRAQTTVELASGQTFAIAGLLERNSGRDVDKIPLLGSIPILGRLFQSVRYQRDESELVILITPFLVEPADGDELALPGQRPPRLPAPTAPVRTRTGELAGFPLD